jgi:hypothetical protein
VARDECRARIASQRVEVQERQARQRQERAQRDAERMARQNRRDRLELAVGCVVIALIAAVVVWFVLLSGESTGSPAAHGRACVEGYSVCLDPNESDYDCEGGSGDGPGYVGPLRVTGSDPFGLDADGDGYACGGD